MAESGGSTPAVDLGALGDSGEGGRAGCGRWGLVGCLAGVVVVAALLASGFFSLKRGVWSAAERARQRVERGLPFELGTRERTRIRANLDRFYARLDEVDDPYPMMGELVRRINRAFADGRLSVAEVKALNEHLESVVGPAPPPPAGRERAEGQSGR